MSEQLSHDVDSTPGISGVTAKSVTELVGTHRVRQPGTPGRGCEQLADRVRAHWGTDRLAEQVHQHEVTRPSPRHARPLQHVRVEGLHAQEVQRHGAMPAGLCPRPVGIVLAAQHMQVRAGDRTPQGSGVGEQVHVGAAQPAQLAAAQPGAGHQQHDQPITGRAART